METEEYSGEKLSKEVAYLGIYLFMVIFASRITLIVEVC